MYSIFFQLILKFLTNWNNFKGKTMTSLFFYSLLTRFCLVNRYKLCNFHAFATLQYWLRKKLKFQNQLYSFCFSHQSPPSSSSKHTLYFKSMHSTKENAKSWGWKSMHVSFFPSFWKSRNQISSWLIPNHHTILCVIQELTFA